MEKVTLALVVLTLAIADNAVAQFDPGQLSVRPEFGLGISNTFGVSFGGAVTYDVSERVAVGPFFTFSTAGRSWKGEEFETKGSNSMAIGGRFYYLLTPDSDYPWYVSAGVGVVKFGSVSETDKDQKFIYNNEEMEIKGVTSFAFNFGTGNLFPIGDNLTLFFDANSHVGSQGDIKGKTKSQDDIDLSEMFEGGAFWLLHTTVGLSLAF